MGTVLRARHAEEGWAKRQGGDVAIKLIHPHIAEDPSFRERFFAEAGLGRKVQHPSVASVFDVVSEEPWLGTVMSLVGGVTLDHWIRPGGLPVHEALALLTPLAHALDHLHGLGIVHRDVKPANIKVRADGTPVILDLGIAKDLKAGEGLTGTATSMGTVGWMAPEQADAKHVGPAADRYALGLITYALLSGQMPWPDDASEARVLTRKLTGELQPLDAARAGLASGVVAAVSAMLAMDPSARPASCGAFISGLSTGGDAPAEDLAGAPEAQRAQRDRDKARWAAEAEALRRDKEEHARKAAAGRARAEAAQEAEARRMQREEDKARWAAEAEDLRRDKLDKERAEAAQKAEAASEAEAQRRDAERSQEATAEKPQGQERPAATVKLVLLAFLALLLGWQLVQNIPLLVDG